ncbi:MAG: TVP38/TMEM64 family protein [Thermodesulfobacteriota bacterium]
MNPDKKDLRPSKKKALIKASILAGFILGGILLFRFTSIRDFLTSDQIGRLLEEAGFMAPMFFILIYAAGICLFIPGTILTGIGAAIFGAYWGFVYVWIGAMMGAVAAFYIGRTLGRDFAASLIGDKLKKYDDAIEKNGFAAVLYLRLIYFPFTPMNFGMGLTKVRFLDYLTGTGLGILVGTFVFTFFIGTLKEIWIGGDWGRLFSVKVLFSVALFISSFFIPKAIKKVRIFSEKKLK